VDLTPAPPAPGKLPSPHSHLQPPVPGLWQPLQAAASLLPAAPAVPVAGVRPALLGEAAAALAALVIAKGDARGVPPALGCRRVTPVACQRRAFSAYWEETPWTQPERRPGCAGGGRSPGLQPLRGLAWSWN